MASEATIIENAPVTPAHTFAWRAFRGFVYGSPDSPEAPVQRPGKENAASPSRRSSPQKLVSMDPNPPLLSPQKRKRDLPPQVSPTKSILRTPGAPTPRTKSLRDVNVKFKSISPEARSGPVSMGAPLAATSEIAQLEQQVHELWEELEQSLVEARSPPKMKSELSQTLTTETTTTTKTKISEKKAQVVDALAPVPNSEQPSNDICRDDYARRTEKEVRRLLRQHKKLRDYAQKADEQNVRLYALVQELQKENARLKGRLDLSDAAPSSARVAGEVSASRETKAGGQKSGSRTGTDSNRLKSEPDSKAKMQPTADPSVSKSEAFKRSLRGEQHGFTIHEDSSRNRKPPQQHTQPRDKLPPADRSSASNLPSSIAATHKDVQRPDLRPTSSLQSLRASSSRTPADPRPTTIQPSNQQQATHRPKSSTSPFSLTALAAQLEPTPAPKQLASSSKSTSDSASASASAAPQPHPHTSPGRHASGPPLNMAPDRVAAARLRLAKKSEERKASQTTYLLEAEMNGNGAGADAKRDEESAVDWANV